MSQPEDKATVNSDRLIHAYDRLLQRAEHVLGSTTARSGTTLIHALDSAREKTIELGELTREEADKVYESVTRDLYDVGRHMAMEKRDIADWLRLNLLVVEKELLDRFTSLAQAAKLELKHLEKARRRLDEWHTGEVTTIGTLRCRHCGELIHFERTGHIPPCPKCHATVYGRVKNQGR
jgi:predicted Zn-ribbon and HTH transcriptional regulator